MHSDDHGRTWQRSPREGTLRVDVLPHHEKEWGFWEPALVEHAPGRLLLMARTSVGWLYESRSQDNGTTWTEPVRSSVPNPIAPPALTQVPGTRTLLLLHNSRVAMGVERLGGTRTLLAWRGSQDAGKTWSQPHPILWHAGSLHLCSRLIPINDKGRWENISLHHLSLPAVTFGNP